MKFFRVMLLMLVAIWLLPAEAEASSTGQPKEPALRMKVDLSSAGPGEVYSSFSQDGYTVMITHPNVDAATQQILDDKNLDVVEVYMETYNKSLAAKSTPMPRAGAAGKAIRRGDMAVAAVAKILSTAQLVSA